MRVGQLPGNRFTSSQEKEAVQADGIVGSDRFKVLKAETSAFCEESDILIAYYYKPCKGFRFPAPVT